MKDTQGLYYTKEYYNTHCGESYENKEVWGPKFEAIAEKIIAEYNPKRVLEVGCAMGYLVEALRDRGVEAYGVDVSEYAISKVREDIKPYCKVNSILEDLPKEFPSKYDLLITIEVIEHLYEDQVNIAMDNLCRYSEQVIFSSSPDDLEEITHVNVQQQEYWAMKFAQRGFYRMVNSDLGYISNYACRYIRTTDLAHTVYDYERRIRETKNGWSSQIREYGQLVEYLKNESGQLKDELQEQQEQQKNQKINGEEKVRELKKKISQLEQQIREEAEQLEEEKTQLEEEIKQYTKAFQNKIEEINAIEGDRQYLRNELNAVRGEYHTVTHSACWKITKPIRFVLDGTKRVLKSNRITALVYKGIVTLKNEGIHSTLRKIKNKLDKRRGKNVNYIDPEVAQAVQAEANSTVNNLLESRMRNTQKIPCIISNENITRINFVTDSIDKHSLLGGVATALIIATEFANRYDLPLRIITRTTDVNPNNYFNIMEISNIKPAKEVSFYSDFDRDYNGDKAFKLDVTPTDIFIATSWWSAEAIKKTTLRKRFYYIIQEVETFFYSHGDEHYRCSQIMEGKNIDYIINSHYLYDYFKENNKNIVENGIYFEPAFPNTIYAASDIVKKEKYKLFFYARPNNPRNMFTYGLKILELCVQRGIIDTDIWDIYCAGQDVPELTFSNGYRVKNLGLMDWKEYGTFLKSVDLALSLMYTPHPSYPPFDVASAGGVVVSNKCLNKNDIEFSSNIILGDLEEEKFLEAMEQGVGLAKNYEQRRKNFEENTIPTDWVVQLQDTIKFMGERI